MKNLLKSKKFIGAASLVLASSMVVSAIGLAFAGKKETKVLSAETDPALLNYDSASSVNFSSVLGRAIDYGIVSDTIDFRDHMESTYATNLLKTTRDNNSDVDLAGSEPAQFIIADIDPNSKAVFGKTYQDGTRMQFVIDTTAELQAQGKFVEANDFNADMLFRTYTKAELNANINSMINRAANQSAMLADKPAFDGDKISKPTNSGRMLDLSDPSFKNCTVYVNVLPGSALESAIANPHQLTIKKDSSTNVVFNVLGSNVTLNQYSMEITDGISIDPSEIPSTITDTSLPASPFSSSTTHSGNDSMQNLVVDKYMAKGVIWNVPNASRVTLMTTAGVILSPSAAPVSVDGPSAGWIITGGTTVINKEFHFIYHGRSDAANTVDKSVLHFAARKSFTDDFSFNPGDKIKELNNINLGNDKYTFTFTETESDYETPAPGAKTYSPVTNDKYGKIVFPTLEYDVTTIDPLNPETHYFVIKETQKDISDSVTDSKISISTGEIDIKLVVSNHEGIIHYDVTTDKYLTAEDKAAGKSYEHDNTTMSGAEFSLGAIFNKYDLETSKISLLKKLDFANNDDSGFPADQEFEVALKNGSSYVQKDGSLGCGEYYFKIKANTPKVISGLIPGSYEIIEKGSDVGVFKHTGTVIDHNNTTSGSTGSTVVLTGKEAAAVDATITNSYEKQEVAGKGTLKLEKKVEVAGKQTVPSNFDDKEFKVTIKNTSTGKYVQDAFGNEDTAEHVFTLTVSESLNIQGLDPNSTYEIYEDIISATESGFTLTMVNGVASPNSYNSKLDFNVIADSVTEKELVNTYTQQTGSFRLVKAFALDNGSPLNADSIYGSEFDDIRKDINFTVTGPNGYTKTLNFYDDFTFEQVNGSNCYVTEFFNDAPLGVYTISETGTDKLTNSDYKFESVKFSYNGGSSLKVEQYVPANFFATNVVSQKKTQVINISKNVVANGVSGIPDNFEIAIIDQDGKYYKPDTTNNTYSFVTDPTYVTISTSQGFVTQPIPVGTYRIEEKIDPISNSNVTHIVNITNDGVITTQKDSPSFVTVTNTYVEYKLEVTKNATNAPYATSDYEFSVKNSNNQYVDSTGNLTGSPYYFSFKAGETVSVPLREKGTYTVVEKDADVSPNSHFSLETTYVPTANNGDKFATIVIDDTTTVGTVTINNDYTYLHQTTPTPAPLDVTISKTAVGGGAELEGAVLTLTGVEADGQTTVTFTDDQFPTTNAGTLTSSGNSLVFTSGSTASVVKGLKDGTYTLTETTAPDGYLKTESMTFEIANGKITKINGTAVASGTTKVQMEDKAISYKLTVKKTATNYTGNDEFSFYVVTDVNGVKNYVQADGSLATTLNTFTVAAGSSKEVTIKRAGSYEVVEVEANLNGATTTYTGATFTVSTDPNATATHETTIENAYVNVPTPSYKIKITKEVTGLAGNAGTYEFAVKKGESYVNNNGTLQNDAYYFAVTANDANGTVVTVPSSGDYKIIEKNADVSSDDNYTLATTYSPSDVISVVDGTVAEVKITNSYTKIDYKINVTKTVDLASQDNEQFQFYVKKGTTYVNGQGTTQTDPYAFTVTAGDITGVDVAVPSSGEYTIVEVAPASVANYTWSVSITDNGIVNLTPSNTHPNVVIANSYTAQPVTVYKIDVDKVLVGVNGDETFEFSVKEVNSGKFVGTDGNLSDNETFFTVTSGAAAVTVNINDAGTYEVSEKAKTLSGYKFVSTTYSKTSCVLDSTNTTDSVTITNEYSAIEYSIDVTKNATGAPASVTEYKFTVSSGNEYVNANGALQTDAYEFSVKSGETVTVKVPSTGDYVVTEVGADVTGYDLTTTYDKNTVSLTDSSNKGSVTISNKYEEITTPAPTVVTPEPTVVTPAPTVVTPEPTPVTPAPVTPTPTVVTPVPTPTEVTPVSTPTPAPVQPILVVVDGNEVDASNYTVDGDGKVTLTEDFVKTLPDGSHKIVTTYSDGSTLTTEFTVTTTPVETGKTTKVTTTSGVVATGETSNETKVQIAMIFMFAAVSVFVYRRRFAKKND